MNYTENYSLLFTDSLIANTVFYGNSEMALDVMLAIGGYDRVIMFIVAIIGYVVSVCINYWFGRVLFKIYNASIDNQTAAENYKSMQEGAQKFGWIMLCFNMVPAIGPFLPVLASFIDFGFKRTLFFAIVARAVYYVWVLLV